MVTLFIILSNNFFEVNHEIIANKIQIIIQNTETIIQKMENLTYKIDINNKNAINENFFHKLFYHLLQKDNININYHYSHFSRNNSIEIHSNNAKSFLDEQALLLLNNKYSAIQALLNFKYKAEQGLIVDIENILKDLEKITSNFK
jgi:hypothetical protein